MLKASLELNRSLEHLSSLAESLGKIETSKVCEIETEGRIRAAVKFLKCYELSVRIDEALDDILRHEGTSEIERSLDRAKELLNDLVKEVESFTVKEKRIFMIYMSDDFLKIQKGLDEVIKKRPGARIWHEGNIREVVKELSGAIGALKKSSAHALVITITPDEGEEYVGKLKC